MGIRTACVLAAIVVPGWPRWFLIAGAVVLPYLAVVVANAGRENDEPGESGVTEQARHAPAGAGDRDHARPGRPTARRLSDAARGGRRWAA